MLPAGLTPCLSRTAASDLNESMSVSNAFSQVALLRNVRTVLGASVCSSPKGSAVCTGAVTGGFAASAVGFFGVCTSAGGGTGVAGVVVPGGVGVAGGASAAGAVAPGGVAGGVSAI